MDRTPFTNTPAAVPYEHITRLPLMLESRTFILTPSPEALRLLGQNDELRETERSCLH